MGALGVGYEWAIRSGGRDEILQRFRDRAIQRPEDEPEASICWGRPSTFGREEPQAIVPSIIVNFPELNDEEDEAIDEWQEIERQETDEIRIENPDDSDQYVMVVDVVSMLFQRPDGRKVRLNFNPPSAEE